MDIALSFTKDIALNISGCGICTNSPTNKIIDKEFALILNFDNLRKLHYTKFRLRLCTKIMDWILHFVLCTKYFALSIMH